MQGDLAEVFTKLDTKIDKKVHVLRNDMTKWKDEILTSNDKVVKKLDQVLTEQKAITVNYKRLDHKVENLEVFAEMAAKVSLDNRASQVSVNSNFKTTRRSQSCDQIKY